MQNAVIMLITAALATLGFSILFYVHPRRLLVATVGGILTTGIYLLGVHFIGGELLPNLLGALAGAGFSEIMGRLTKVPVPVYMVPCIIPLVPGGALYETMFSFVTGNYLAAAGAGMRTLQIALGIAGGIVIASVLGIRACGDAQNGQIIPTQKPRGQKKATEVLAAMIRERGFTNDSWLRIAHCFGEAQAQLLIDAVKKDFPNARYTVEPTGALCSFYAEEGGLMIAMEGAFNEVNNVNAI